MTGRRRIGRVGVATAAAAGVGIAAGVVFGVVPDLVARRKNPVRRRPPYPASEGARELHRTLEIVDLHADTLLWGRDLLVRAGHSHVDVPRLIEGGIAIEGLAVSTKVPRRANMERNDDRTDDVTLLAIAQRWPPSTCAASWPGRSTTPTGHDRWRIGRTAGSRSSTRRPGSTRIALGGTTDRSITAAFLAIEGAHALEDDPANVDRLIAAGFRMLSPTHFFDNAFGGSAHGVAKGGLTPLGRELVARMEAGAMIVDVAHASEATIDDVLAVATRPVVASHTGVRASHDVTRNLADAHVRGIAATGGLVGIGFWPTATGGDDPASIARSIRAAVGLVGVDHVGLGSDFDGGVPVPFDATGIVQITDRLLGDGFTDEEIARIMGGNALRVLAAALPE